MPRGGELSAERPPDRLDAEEHEAERAGNAGRDPVVDREVMEQPRADDDRHRVDEDEEERRPARSDQVRSRASSRPAAPTRRMCSTAGMSVRRGTGAPRIRSPPRSPKFTRQSTPASASSPPTKSDAARPTMIPPPYTPSSSALPSARAITGQAMSAMPVPSPAKARPTSSTANAGAIAPIEAAEPHAGSRPSARSRGSRAAPRPRNRLARTRRCR